MPRLSIIVCTYDRLSRLAVCLESLARYPWRDFEVVLVNDGGGIGPEELAYKYRDRLDLRYHYVNPATPAYRLAACRNVGLRDARAVRAMTLDDDCAPLAGTLEAHAEPDAASLVVAGWRLHVPRAKADKLKPRDVAKLASSWTREDERIHARNLDHFKYAQATPGDHIGRCRYCWGCNLSYPTDVARALGGFDEKFQGWGAEDYDMAVRLARAGCAVELRPELLVYHLDHAKLSMSSARKNRDLARRSLTSASLVRNGGPL